MKRLRRSVAVLVAIGTAFAVTPIAGAQPPSTEQVLDKAEYEPGETIVISVKKPYKCVQDVTSEGFVATVRLKTVQKPEYALTGEATAVDAPGSYEVNVSCFDRKITNTFTVKGTVTTPSPEPPQPPGTPAPKPKPPIVKPKGAPDTGGGGMAAR